MYIVGETKRARLVVPRFVVERDCWWNCLRAFCHRSRRENVSIKLILIDARAHAGHLAARLRNDRGDAMWWLRLRCVRESVLSLDFGEAMRVLQIGLFTRS